MKGLTILLIICSLFCFMLSAYKIFMVYSHPVKYLNNIEVYAKEFELPPSLVASVINTESGFNEDAKSNKGAVGLMQIKLSTANYLNELNNLEILDEKELFKPETNIYYGCMYLKYLMKKFNNLNTSLAAYNAGETRVRSWLKSGVYSLDGETLMYIPFEETRNYIKKINENIKYYKKII